MEQWRVELNTGIDGKVVTRAPKQARIQLKGGVDGKIVMRGIPSRSFRSARFRVYVLTKPSRLSALVNGAVDSGVAVKTEAAKITIASMESADCAVLVQTEAARSSIGVGRSVDEGVSIEMGAVNPSVAIHGKTDFGIDVETSAVVPSVVGKLEAEGAIVVDFHAQHTIGIVPRLESENVIHIQTHPAQLSFEQKIEFSCTGAVQIVTLSPGRYLLKCWGAKGGYETPSTPFGGNGGYAEGIITLTETTALFVYVGGSGRCSYKAKTDKDGFNGGGTRDGISRDGGGASDIRIKTDSLYARVIVAGGGGSVGEQEADGGAGGGENGISSSRFGNEAGGGTQTEGGHGYGEEFDIDMSIGVNGSFGNGGNGISARGGYGGAGGGGWYGGGGCIPDADGFACGGAGGSGFVWIGQTLTLPEDGVWLLGAEYALEEALMRSGGNNSDGRVTIERLF